MELIALEICLLKKEIKIHLSSQCASLQKAFSSTPTISPVQMQSLLPSSKTLGYLATTLQAHTQWILQT
eukprot:3187048-Ditylum_brightwellii.AAC.1